MVGLSPAAKARLIDLRMRWLYDGGDAVWTRKAREPRHYQDLEREPDDPRAARFLDTFAWFDPRKPA